jgi:hypothetical protein
MRNLHDQFKVERGMELLLFCEKERSDSIAARSSQQGDCSEKYLSRETMMKMKMTFKKMKCSKNDVEKKTVPNPNGQTTKRERMLYGKKYSRECSLIFIPHYLSVFLARGAFLFPLQYELSGALSSLPRSASCLVLSSLISFLKPSREIPATQPITSHSSLELFIVGGASGWRNRSCCEPQFQSFFSR